MSMRVWACLAAVAAGLAVGQSKRCEAQVGLWIERDREVYQHIYEALEAPLSARFDQMSLDRALAALAREASINLLIDRRSLEFAGVRATVPVTLEASDLSLRSLLDAMLEEHDLVWTLAHGAVVVTTPESEEVRYMLTRVYPVLDLVRTHYASEIVEDYSGLIDVIAGTLAPESWYRVGGPAAIDYVPSSGALVVSQSRRVHEELEQLLTALRAARRLQRIEGEEWTATGSVPWSAEVERLVSRPAARPAPPRHPRPASAAPLLPRLHE